MYMSIQCNYIIFVEVWRHSEARSTAAYMEIRKKASGCFGAGHQDFGIPSIEAKSWSGAASKKHGWHRVAVQLQVPERLDDRHRTEALRPYCSETHGAPVSWLTYRNEPIGACTACNMHKPKEKR